MSDNTTQQEPITYRDAVQSIIADLNNVYDKIGALRDFASSNEKDVYNDARGKLYEVRIAFIHFNDRMSVSRATSLLK